MNLHLTSAYSSHTGLDSLCQYAALSSSEAYTLCEEPEQADAILFVENTHFDDILFHRLMRHPLVNKFPDKVFIYNEMDRPWDVMPGLYCCMPRKHANRNRHRPFAYLCTPNPYISDIFKQEVEPRWLYSFMGSMSHACRRPIMQLQHSDGYVEDTSDFNVWRTNPNEMAIRVRAYADVLASSLYVLCPRGIGTSSIRLYETLEAGRVPVIISDQWVPPLETDWQFALRIREKDIASIPEQLTSLKGEAKERGLAARKVWETHYSPQRMFVTVCEAVESLLHNTERCQPRGSRAQIRKWVVTGGLLARNAAERLRSRSAGS